MGLLPRIMTGVSASNWPLQSLTAKVVLIGLAVCALGSRGPIGFGRIFEQNHSAVVGFRTSKGWEAGFVVGAQGEFLVGTGQQHPGTNFLVQWNGQQHTARCLAYNADFGIAFARLEKSRRTVPLSPSSAKGIKRERWALVLAVNKKGKPEPFAGVFTMGPTPARKWAQLMATGRRGSAVLDTHGRLLGVALDNGRRATRVLPIESLTTFMTQALSSSP